MQINYTIHFKSEDALRQTKELVRSKISLNEIHKRTLVSCPNGIKAVEETFHVLGDYFDKIELLESDGLAFKLAFHVKEDAPSSFWKDLILRTLRTSASRVSADNFAFFKDRTTDRTPKTIWAGSRY